MAYSKFPKVRRDAPFGIRGINQLNDNVKAVRDLYAAEHNIPVSGRVQVSVLGDGSIKPGQHDTPLIPRTVGVLTVSSTTLFNGTVQYFVTLPVRGRLLISAGRMFQGAYLLRTPTGTNLWCEAYPVGSSSEPRRTIVRPSNVPNMPGFIVQLLRLSAGAWVTGDYSFHFAINAEDA